MAQPPSLILPKVSDLVIGDGPLTGKDLKVILQKYFGIVNPFFDQLQKLGSKGASFADNFRCDTGTYSFSHGVAKALKLRTLVKATGLMVINSTGKPVNGWQVQMAQTSADIGPQAIVTLYFIDPTAADVPCSVVLLDS